MRFKSQIRNVNTFAKFCASLASLGQIAWCRLTDDDVRFTVIPEKGSQAWSVLKIGAIFESYIIQSASPQNTINLEIPVAAFSKALRSAVGATSVHLRLTKKNNIPMLSLTIVSNTFTTGSDVAAAADLGTFEFCTGFHSGGLGDVNDGGARERETIVTQDVPVKVLPIQDVEGFHEPRTREPDVHIYLPNIQQVKSISERFTRLAMAATNNSASPATPRLEMAANMHGSLKIGIRTDSLSISSIWTGLVNPELDPSTIENGSQGVRDHPSTKMKLLGGEYGEDQAGWSTVQIDGRDWSRVLSVGRLGVRVIACFMKETGLVLYVYLPSEDDSADESCLTYYISSFGA